MRLTKEQLRKIVDDHQHWINRDVENWRHMRADLSDLDLSKTVFHGFDLRGARFCRTDLSGADLAGVNLRSAILEGANLSDANLSWTNMGYTCLSNTNLYHAYLYKANLSNAILDGANLEKADLFCANLHGADLYCANLKDTNLGNANINRADLSTAKNIPFIPLVCPETGSFIGYKKANRYIVELEILSDAKRSSATTRKCRCNKARVLSIQFSNGTKADITSIRSDYDHNFVYKVGEIVEVKNFNKNRWNECAPGIHFFINRQEAVEY